MWLPLPLQQFHEFRFRESGTANDLPQCSRPDALWSVLRNCHDEAMTGLFQLNVTSRYSCNPKACQFQGTYHF